MNGDYVQITDPEEEPIARPQQHCLGDMTGHSFDRVARFASVLAIVLMSNSSAAAASEKDAPRGHVESAFDDAWKAVVSGARSTAKAGDWVIEKTSNGAVAVWRQTKAAGQGAAHEVNDAKILTVIKSRLVADPSTKAADIHVSVDKGVVTLDGSVKDAEEAKTAIRLATQTGGVNRVVSNLQWPGMPAPPAHRTH